jgi:hypothetical protein
MVYPWSRSLFDARGKLVSLARNRHDNLFALPACTQRLTQQKHVLRQIALFHKGVGPHPSQQFFLGHHLVRVLGKIQQQIEGFWP